MTVIDRLEDWCRAGMPSTPERIAWAKAYIADESLAALTGNYIPSEPQPPRKPLTLSSHVYCPRQLWFKVNGRAEEDMGPRTYNTFFVGRTVEKSVVARCILAGLPVLSPVWGGARQRRVYMDLGAAEPYGGSLDLAFAADLKAKIDGPEAQAAYWDSKAPVILADCKSRNDNGFREAVGERRIGNDYGYEDQLGAYAMACEAEGRRVTELLFLLQMRSQGEEAEVDCPRPPGLEAEFRASFAAATGSVLPDRPSWAILRRVNSPSGPVDRIDNRRCGYCPTKFSCYDGLERKIVSKKVEHQIPVRS